jgi:hypothetical protein
MWNGSIVIQGPPAGSGSVNPPGVTDPFVDFTVGDGQTGSPNDGDTFWRVATFDGQQIFNKRLLVIREGIALNWNTPVASNGEIRRYNSGGLGGFTWESSGPFIGGQRYQIYIVGTDTTIET